MKTERLEILVELYRSLQKKLRKIRAEQDRIVVSLEIFNDLERELNSELRSAKGADDQEMVKYWQEMIKEYFNKDKDKASPQDLEKAKKKISKKDEKVIQYHEKKLKIIGKILGAREAEILETYEQKNILMESEGSSSSRFYEMEKEEAEDLRRELKRKNSATFDKL